MLIGFLLFSFTTESHAGHRTQNYFNNRDEAVAACLASAAANTTCAPGGQYLYQCGALGWGWDAGNGLLMGEALETKSSWIGYACAPVSQHFHAYLWPRTACPAGTTFAGPPSNNCRPLGWEKNLGGCSESGGSTIGNPCNPANGNKYQRESDYSGKSGELNLERHYNSLLAYKKTTMFGAGWTSNSNLRLEIILYTNGQPTRIRANRANGRVESFNCDLSTCQADDPDINSILVPVGPNTNAGYKLITAEGAIEQYEKRRYLISITDHSGKTTSFIRDEFGNLQKIIGPFGGELSFTYNTNRHVTRIDDPAGNSIGYAYDSNKNLTSVSYPDNSAIIYHYDDVAFPNHLTGISYATVNPDGSFSNVIRYASFEYDASGKAILTEHAQTDNPGPQEKFTLNYDSATQTTVTDPVDAYEVMSFQTNLGVKNLTSKQLYNASGVAVDAALQQAFDGNNNLVCRKDEAGHVTTYQYNPTNQRTGRTEGLAGNCTNPATVAGVTRTTTYEYLSPTLDLPRFIRRPSVASGQTFETEMVYGDPGHPNLPTQIIQRGFTPAGSTVTRAVTLGYNAYGQVNGIDGPRTDVSDITTLEYYECTTGGACGQLKKVINALGQVTTYDVYDANGRLLQMTDPNGLVTTYIYDPRGRVKTVTRTPASGTAAITQYSYTPWGDVSQVIDPDGVVLDYQYDAAHDLRFIVDAAGNYIHYKYDLKGNRSGEDTYDSTGSLKRTLGYAYDLRNHL
ncbi:MAG: DUF6531 domain-containing protein, partial [Gammaproteobacteria bacterium]|nr:DUF6531 domain-containing protein [Gammaproteobacteria bacterium]